MNIIKNVLFAVIFICSIPAFSQQDCKITYIANEGFLVETANKKILVDALFGGFKGNWCVQPDEGTKSKLENAVDQFNNVDIIAITHRHIDHFNKEMVISHILKNPDCMVICPEQVDSILSSHQNYEKVKNNIIAVTPDFSNDSIVNVKGIGIKIFRFEHGHYYELDSATGEKINIHRNTENTAFLFNAGNIKIFHCGDAYTMDDTEYKNFDLINEHIDIAFLSRLFMYHISAKGIEIIENLIKPKNIVLMHIEPDGIRVYKDVASQAGDRFPNIFMFEKPMEYKVYNIKAND